MKTALYLTLLGITFSSFSQSPVGGWEATYNNEQGAAIKMVVILSNEYQVATRYAADTGAFIGTNGGTWRLDGNTMTEVVEFDSSNPEKVGSSISFEVSISDAEMSIVGTDLILKRLDDGTPGKLAGAWLMSGRKRNGNIQNRDINRSRKTMKILSGTRFQWIAYDTATKDFKGTGGGTYTTIDGTYTENIEFFSRDDSRVGASLEFNFELVDDKWHHSGLSSKGQPLYEIWSQR